jgi:hypothetical protein
MLEYFYLVQVNDLSNTLAHRTEEDMSSTSFAMIGGVNINPNDRFNLLQIS